ncbi:MAG: O-antigen ligase family protein [Chloroflexi bacterium]|nr:O-antigen ligase family protein [Chloroflexota bacterium]
MISSPLFSHAPHVYGGSLRPRWVTYALQIAVVSMLGVVLASAPLTPVALVVGAVFYGLLVLRWPTLSLYPLALAIPFGALREISLGPATAGISEILLWSALGAWFLCLLANRRLLATFRAGWSPIAWALLFYTGSLTLSLLPATQMGPALKELAKWIELLLVYLWVRSSLNEARRLQVAAAFLLAGLLQGLLGIYQFLYQVGPPGFILLGRYMRAHGTFLQPNPYAGYLGLLLPLAYGTVVVGGGEVWRSFKSGAWLRPPWAVLYWALALASAIAMLAGLLMSWSRGALVGLMAGAGLVGLALARWSRWAVGGAMLILLMLVPLLLAVVPAVALARFTDVLAYMGQDLSKIEVTDENFAVLERAAHWQAAWRMFALQPWIGVGTGQYAVVYPQVALPRWQDPLGHAHNIYLHTLAEGGLIGLGAYLLVAIVGLRSTWRAADRGTSLARGLALGALGMWGHLLAHHLFDNLFVHELYLLVGVLLALADRQSPKPAETAGQEGIT